jgi:hypothetical protein
MSVHPAKIDDQSLSQDGTTSPEQETQNAVAPIVSARIIPPLHPPAPGLDSSTPNSFRERWHSNANPPKLLVGLYISISIRVKAAAEQRHARRPRNTDPLRLLSRDHLSTLFIRPRGGPRGEHVFPNTTTTLSSASTLSYATNTESNDHPLKREVM